VPNGKIAIGEIGNWLDVNENFTSLMATYEPDLHVEEKSSTFLPIPRHPVHLQNLSEEYLGKKYMSDMGGVIEKKKKKEGDITLPGVKKGMKRRRCFAMSDMNVKPKGRQSIPSLKINLGEPKN
jgi:hypothetical protein